MTTLQGAWLEIAARTTKEARYILNNSIAHQWAYRNLASRKKQTVPVSMQEKSAVVKMFYAQCRNVAHYLQKEFSLEESVNAANKLAQVKLSPTELALYSFDGRVKGMIQDALMYSVAVQ